MAHVLIRNGVVVGISDIPQPGIPDFQDMADDDTRLLAFLSPPPEKPRQITPSQFLNRLPPATLPTLFSNPQTGVMLVTLAAATMIDLTDPQVQGGINGLVPSVLTAQQAATVLDH
jgi:hypothetical protein